MSSNLTPSSKMAENGKVNMAKTEQRRSLVSEQYLDGWPLDNEDEGSEDEGSEDESNLSPNNEDKNNQALNSNKRQHEAEVESEPGEKKKFCMSMTTSTSTKIISKDDVGVPAKISLNMASSASKTKAIPIKLDLHSQAKQKDPSSIVRKSAAVVQAFNQDSDDSEDEMPPEARMRMRNIGRDTPTAAGPNSFGKGRLGFCDRQKIIERSLQQKEEDEK